jgi:DNA-binding MarR family transcriptional regulator
MTTNGRECEELARNIRRFRRAIWRDTVLDLTRDFGDFEFSLPQMVVLLLLEEREIKIKRLSELLGRSASATGRLVEQLVRRNLVSRREDERDRRTKRVAITERGRSLIDTLEQRRANAQVAVMRYLSDEERAEVARVMALLAEAGERRKRDEGSTAGSGT